MRFVVFASPYNEESGGNIVLWLLCERLRKLGFDAYIWPSTAMYNYIPRSWKDVGRILLHVRDLITGSKVKSGPFSLPIATRDIVRDSILVYPEVVNGNPLRGRKIVRWFLHRPGHHTGTIRFGRNELYFFYQDAFNDPDINPDSGNRLTITYLHPAYQNLCAGDRSTTCVLVRKGKDRLGSVALRGDVIIDGMSHEQIAAEFNKAGFLQSLDQYSMYSIFAAICGCTPVIEPMPGVSKKQWFPREEDRYGLAYGWDDIDWAIRTRPLLVDKIMRDREIEDQMVIDFARKADEFFRKC